ncbi:unnamed protein product [Effrenium voratum]|nr:unnamed protein product [Effrenium voratum]CAJ1422489.1 unnamed protein product [Effrenium voratum]
MAGPTLRDWMSENKNLTETNAAELTRQMLRAVHFLHRTAGALHRDVKPQNFGFAAPVGDQLPMLQLFDMGLVYVLPEPVVEETAQQLFDLGLGGTLHWIAPETWEGRSGAASDLWSVGLILHVLLLKVLPFSLQSCKEPQETRQAIAKGQLAQQGASKEGLALAARLLAKDPKERATSTEALDNAWLKAPPKTKHTVASAASAQKRCQLPEEVERWKDRSFWHSLMLSQGHWLKAE